MWGPDAPHVQPSRAARNFFIAVGVFGTIGLFAKLNAAERPAVGREYPFSGLVTELGGLDANKVRIGTSFALRIYNLNSTTGEARNGFRRRVV
jgi:NADH dehydrogenase (ubiquinone) 1 beta subcomplex subunit 8